MAFSFPGISHQNASMADVHMPGCLSYHDGNGYMFGSTSHIHVILR